MLSEAAVTASPVLHLSDKELALIQAVIDQGGAITIAVLIVVALSLVAWKLGGQFLAVLQAQASASGRQADAMAGQASAMAEMKDALTKYILKDNDEHREILLGLSVMASEMKELVRAVNKSKREARSDTHDQTGCNKTRPGQAPDPEGAGTGLS